MGWGVSAHKSWHTRAGHDFSSYTQRKSTLIQWINSAAQYIRCGYKQKSSSLGLKKHENALLSFLVFIVFSAVSNRFKYRQNAV